MMNKEPVTVWKRHDSEKDQWVVNHVDTDMGHDSRDSPIPKTDEEAEKWEEATWKKEFGYLIGRAVVSEKTGNIIGYINNTMAGGYIFDTERGDYET